MITFPNAKINLGLRIVGKRADGYHDLDTVFLPIPLCDVLEIVPTESHNSTTLQTYGLQLDDANAEQNLAMKAFRELSSRLDKQASPAGSCPTLLPSIQMHLYKRIPTGAGMGGGSSDATHALIMLRDLFELPITTDELQETAVKLGADCPFFLKNTPCHATGIGDIIEPIKLTALTGMHIVVVKPPLHISTAEAFRGIKPQDISRTTKDIVLHEPVTAWRDLLHNDFEDSLFPHHPQLAEIKEHLYETGAIYASMTGSGAALYGLYPCTFTPSCIHSAFPDNCFVWTHSLPLY